MDIEHYKNLLLKECRTLEGELKTVGRKNPDQPGDWEAEEKEVDSDSADEADLADKIEQYEGNSAILNQLETRLNEVKKALAKIEDGSYGKCEVCEMDIEEDRLNANPAATTCKQHMGE